jgi:dTDP-4-amino-4,6-dideoxygalactose transaminase
VPEQPALRALDESKRAYPAGARLCTEVLSLPIYPELSNADVDRIASSLAQCCALAAAE